MTYRDLLNELLVFSAFELEQDAMVHTIGLDEFFQVIVLRVVGADGDACPAVGVLDNGNHFMEIEG